MENIIQKKYSIYIREVFEEVSKDIILPLYGNLSKTQISTKSNNNDLVTEADKLAEIFIKSKLNILSENFNFIGEESYNNDIIKEIENSNSLFTWTCDPIDGTFNFVNNEEKFCIMISLCRSKIPIFSWLYFPVFEILFFPVYIFGCPPAIISGFILKAIFAKLFFFFAIEDKVYNSSKDSTLNCSILFSKAKAISSLLLPTPEYTILLLGIPASNAFFNSPIETISAPAPHLAKVFSIERLEFAFTEKAIIALIPFNAFFNLLKLFTIEL